MSVGEVQEGAGGLPKQAEGEELLDGVGGYDEDVEEERTGVGGEVLQRRREEVAGAGHGHKKPVLLHGVVDESEVGNDEDDCCDERKRWQC